MSETQFDTRSTNVYEIGVYLLEHTGGMTEDDWLDEHGGDPEAAAQAIVNMWNELDWETPIDEDGDPLDIHHYLYRLLDKRADERRAEAELNSVMTSSEIEDEFGLAAGTARMAAYTDSIPARKSGGTWLIRRADAEARWGGRDS